MRSPLGSHHNDGPDDHHADAHGLYPKAPLQRDPAPNVACRIISPIHLSDQAATAAAMLAALGGTLSGSHPSSCRNDGREGPDRTTS